MCRFYLKREDKMVIDLDVARRKLYSQRLYWISVAVGQGGVSELRLTALFTSNPISIPIQVTPITWIATVNGRCSGGSRGRTVRECAPQRWRRWHSLGSGR